MTSSSATTPFSFLLSVIAVATLLSVLASSFSYADDNNNNTNSAQPTLTPLVNPNDIKIKMRKGDVKMIDFFLSLSRAKKAYPTMLVSITSFPKRGRIFALPQAKLDKSKNGVVVPSFASMVGSNARRRRAQLLSTFSREITPESSTALRTSAGNMFLYVSARNTTNQRVFDAYEDSFTFSVTDGNYAGGKEFEGTARISVYNSAPTVPSKVITKFVRTTVGSDSNMNQISIDFNTKMMKNLASSKIPLFDSDLSLCGSSEIESVTIVDGTTGYLSGGNACQIKTLKDDKELKDGMVLKGDELILYATFPNNLGDFDKKMCKVSYIVKDSSGAVSKSIGTLQFQQKSVTDDNKPKVYDRQYRFYPTHQKFVVISLSSYGQAQSAVKLRQRPQLDGGLGDRGARPTVTLPSGPSEDDESVILGKRSFYITQYPGIGSLYVVPSMASLSADPSFLEKHLIKKDSKNPNKKIKIWTGLSRRIHVLYKLDPTITREQLTKIFDTNETFSWKTRSVDGILSDAARVTITFRENNRNAIIPGRTWNKNGTTTTRGFQCGTRTYKWVFWNRAVNKVRLNFTLPRDDKVETITLLSSVGSPLSFGKMFKQSTRIYGLSKMNTTELKPGVAAMTLSDVRWPRFRFVPDPIVSQKLVLKASNGTLSSPPIQTFKFKITTKQGSQCVADVVFKLVKHERKQIVTDPYTGKKQSQTVIYDTAPYGRYTLFALRGNRTTNDKYKYVRFVSSPIRGAMFRVNADTLPYDKGMTSQDTIDPASDEYCVRHDCGKYVVEPRIRKEHFIEKSALWSKTGEMALSADRFWIIYRAPFKRSAKKENDFMGDVIDKRAEDEFSIQYCTSKSESDCDSEVLSYQLHLQEGPLRRIYFPYSRTTNVISSNNNNNKINDKNIKTFDDMTVVPITLGNSKETLVRILDFNQESRHGVPPEFRLYQARRNGANSFDFGPAITEDTSSDRYTGLKGKFIKTDNSDENTILLVPNSGTRYQNFRFRARLYNRTILDGIKDWNIDTTASEDRMKTLGAFEDVRVIAVRENNPPKWNATAIDREWGDIPLGKSVSWEFIANDKDNDQLTFIIRRAPKHSDLFIVYNVLGRIQSVKATDGLRFTAPRGNTDSRSVLDVEFRPRFEPSLIDSYPLNETFSIIVDDGSGILSEPLDVTARIVAPLEGWKGKFSKDVVRKDIVQEAKGGSHLILILVITLLIAVAGGILYFMKKRNLLRQQFSKLASIDSTEMS